MRPLKLTMEGFGPYKKKTVLDMEKLGDGGLYLVTGDTGSGKTFIFDAISYALYGEMSGASRDSRSVRSQYASEDEPTEVELVFSFRGRTYTVRRNPEYMRRKKSGEGYTKKSAGASLTGPDGVIADGTSKVSAAVRELLGIDRGQFCSIVMIAQGEFRKVLNASTDERRLLFRKLFDTQAYDRLVDELRERSRAVSEAFERKQAAIKQTLSSVSCSFDDELGSELEDMKLRSGAGEAAAADMLAVIGRITEAGELRAAETADRLRDAEERLSDAVRKETLIDDHRKNVNSLEEARKAVSALEARIEEAKKSYEEAESEKPHIDKLSEEAALLKNSLDAYKKLDEVRNELKASREKRDGLEAELEAAEKQRDILSDELSSLKKEYELIKDSGSRLVSIRSEAERKEAAVKRYGDLLERIGRVRELKKHLLEKQEEAGPLIKEAEQKAAEHAAAAAALLRNQAGLMAEGLREGEPCPVCGSLSHPSPASLEDCVLTEDDVREMEKAAAEARRRAGEKTGEVQTVRGSLESAEESAYAAAEKETGSSDISEAELKAQTEAALLGKELEELSERETEEEKNAARAMALGKEIPDAQKAADEAASRISGLRAELAGAEAEAAGAEKRLADTAKGLAFESRSEAEIRIDEISEEIRSCNEAIKRAAEVKNAAINDRQANDARIEELGRIISEYSPVNEEAVHEQKQKAELDKALLDRLKTDIAADIRSLRSAGDRIKADVGELEDIRRDHEIIDSLYRTAAGSLTGKEKLSLETYVQMFYFERIIKRANLRLSKISGGQYEFVRGSRAADMRSQYGLDLYVADHYTGSERPVSTLSGGESFMASLSLALGLSDEVQSSAGGIRLDTMFIDEGFGSLDSEMLEKAVRTLTELTGGDKLVGIISHVDALKTRIDRQIAVSKSRDCGSRAVIVC